MTLPRVYRIYSRDYAEAVEIPYAEGLGNRLTAGALAFMRAQSRARPVVPAYDGENDPTAAPAWGGPLERRAS